MNEQEKNARFQQFRKKKLEADEKTPRIKVIKAPPNRSKSVIIASKSPAKANTSHPESQEELQSILGTMEEFQATMNSHQGAGRKRKSLDAVAGIEPATFETKRMSLDLGEMDLLEKKIVVKLRRDQEVERLLMDGSIEK